MKTKKNRSGLHKASIGLLTVGLIFSILTFISSILGLLGYGLLYFGAIIIFLAVVLVIYAVVFLTTGVLFGLVNAIILFIEALVAGGSGGSMSFSGIWPDIDWNLISPSTWGIFGISSLAGLFVFPLLIILIITSLFAMIFAIVALANVSKGKSKGGMITGGVFAILSSLLGQLTIFEFIGGILAFIPEIKKKDDK